MNIPRKQKAWENLPLILPQANGEADSQTDNEGEED